MFFLRGNKEKDYDKKIPCGVFICLLTFNFETRIYPGFLDYITFKYFLANCCYFQKLKPTPINFALKFRENEPNLYFLNILFFCCTVNQASKITFLNCPWGVGGI